MEADIRQEAHHASPQNDGRPHTSWMGMTLPREPLPSLGLSTWFMGSPREQLEWSAGPRGLPRLCASHTQSPPLALDDVGKVTSPSEH
jgi:hypothetical protein